MRRKHFRKFIKRTSVRKRAFFKGRGGYADKFSSGRRSSLQHRFTRLTNVALSARTSMLKKRYRSARYRASQVNKKLETLKRWGRYDTWASKQLIGRLDSYKLKMIDKSGLINIDNIQWLNLTQLTALEKSMDQFIKSKTSTIQGINAVVRKKRQDLIEKSDNPQWVKGLTNREIEDLYKIFDDEDFTNLSEHIKYEALWDTIIEMNQKTEEITEMDFKAELEQYIDPEVINDDDVLDSITNIYEKYIQ